MKNRKKKKQKRRMKKKKKEKKIIPLKDNILGSTRIFSGPIQLFMVSAISPITLSP